MIKLIIKFSFAFGILFYLISKGDLDFNLVLTSLKERPGHIIIGIITIFLGTFISSYRWKILLQIKSKKNIPPLKVVCLTWIGTFFSSILPGAVTGDLIKLVYAKDLDENLNKTFLVTSALLDRIIGLIGLLFLLGLFSFTNYTQLISLSPKMGPLLKLNGFFFLVAMLFLLTLFLPRTLNNKFVVQLKKIPILGVHVAKTMEQVWLIGENKKVVLKALFLSIIIQANSVFAIWYITNPYFSSPLSLVHAFTFVPLGLMAMAIPISPAGLGVGHAIFGTLFSFYGINKGASLFNLYFLSYISVNLIGIFPYLFSGKKYQLKEHQLKEHQLKENEIFNSAI